MGANGKLTEITQEFVSTARETLETLYAIPTVSKAKLLKSEVEGIYSVEYETKQLDFVREVPRTYSSQATIKIDGSATVISKTSAVELVGVSGSKTIEIDGKLFGVVLRSTETKGSKKRFVEVWENNVLEKSMEVTNIHGEFYADETFGGVAWSPSGRYIAYVAEPKEFDAFKPRGFKKNEENENSFGGMADPRRYEFNEDYGETFTGKRPPVLFVVDVDEESIKQVEGELGGRKDISPGQPIWMKETESEELVFTGYIVEPRHLGQVYCMNRPSQLFSCDAEGNGLRNLTDTSETARSPRVAPDHKSVVYLSSNPFGAHSGASRLVRVWGSSGEREEIIPIVDLPSKDSVGGLPARFPGLFTLYLPKDPWVQVGEKTFLFCETIWNSSNAVIAVDIEAKKVSKIAFPRYNQGSMSFLSEANGIVLMAYSNPAKCGEIVAGHISVNGSDVSVDNYSDLGLIAAKTKGAKLIEEGIEWSVLEYPERTEFLETILTKPKMKTELQKFFWGDSLPPLAVYPHGGPHATFVCGINMIPTFLTILGFVVAQVNYTGSLGFGQKSVDSLVGRIGDLEVDEIVYVAKDLGEKMVVDAGRMVYNGGSHSGYTGAHIAGRYGGLFRGLVLRNPVVNIGEMHARSDIPDWCFGELGMEYTGDMKIHEGKIGGPLMTPEAYKIMWDASPQKYAAQVKDPILVNIGLSDRRVPPEQGYQFCRLVKANGNKEVECKVYPNVGHPLDTVEAIRESVVGFLCFYYKHIGLKR
ncbi:hypothetical protein BB558_000474 [Smittium angustum]|uniref:Acylamino-acid-releasing enzyme n=1 Tax=Smittium angustum TaxID=133377 RepID=A0A2U1JEA4_SMIAN|nr:hypothetical protein BB558_000474 [Smittium angustum]